MKSAHPAAISAHMRFGLHKEIDRGCAYVTVLREPVARTISAYGHLSRDPRSRLHVAAVRSRLGDFVSAGLLKDLDNGQVRRLSGVGDTVPFRQCDESHLRLALANIDRHFSTVGLTERFDESALLISEVMGWSWPFYWKQNSGRGRTKLATTRATWRSCETTTSSIDCCTKKCPRGSTRRSRIGAEGFRSASPRSAG